MSESHAVEFVQTRQDDPRAAPLLDELGVEYQNRYGELLPDEYVDLHAYPGTDFEPPTGAMILGIVDGLAVAGGAFRRFDHRTAELKRIWTSSTVRAVIPRPGVAPPFRHATHAPCCTESAPPRTPDSRWRPSAIRSCHPAPNATAGSMR